jgi:hypothetical protein
VFLIARHAAQRHSCYGRGGASERSVRQGNDAGFAGRFDEAQMAALLAYLHTGLR